MSLVVLICWFIDSVMILIIPLYSGIIRILGKKDFLGIFVELRFLNASSREDRELLEGV